ncbi:MAG: 4Fe-4S dicluster domain-containing protein [Deltaproteobacteria bacterium]|nr:4Fe-4S dicluster domain-containing protein [Deltaproteobacteria bacterium]
MANGKDMIAEAKRSSGAHSCVECGRCVAVCPMAEMYSNFSIEMSPRGVIKKALTGNDIITDENIWYCTECNAGTDVCPQGVSCRDLIRGLREIAIEENIVEDLKHCTRCGRQFVSIPVENFVFERLREEPPNVLDVLELCPSCKREVYMLRNT